jgi:hypothetical protein
VSVCLRLCVRCCCCHCSYCCCCCCYCCCCSCVRLDVRQPDKYSMSRSLRSSLDERKRGWATQTNTLSDKHTPFDSKRDTPSPFTAKVLSGELTVREKQKELASISNGCEDSSPDKPRELQLTSSHSSRRSAPSPRSLFWPLGPCLRPCTLFLFIASIYCSPPASFVDRSWVFCTVFHLFPPPPPHRKLPTLLTLFSRMRAKWRKKRMRRLKRKRRKMRARSK